MDTSIIRQRLWTASELYLGLPIRDLELVEDPFVAETYAMQVTKGDGTKVHFLIEEYGHKPARELARMLEEVEFCNWPPTSNGGAEPDALA